LVELNRMKKSRAADGSIGREIAVPDGKAGRNRKPVGRKTMAVTLKLEEAASRVTLEGAVDISSAADLKAALMQAVDAGVEVVVSLAGATDLDVTAVQLLWAARRAAADAGIEFSFGGKEPEAIATALQDAGLELLGAGQAVQ
jgi:anti-anti-sigma regulatory factor